ncbi:MAG: hypothetical protein FJ288_06775, partial [Planctomycetes bacterium]|nr:hypothetical protein [Planctomycetota bacterium]
MTPQPQPGNADPRAEQVARMVAFFRAGQADALESAWMEFLEDPAVSLADLGPVLGEVASQKNARVMESLLWLLLSVWGEQRGPDAALDAARQVAHLLPDTAALRDEVAGLCRAVHAGAPGIDTLLEMTVLRRDLAPAAALAAMDRLLALPPGTFVADSRRRSPGRVVGVETARKVLAVSFGQADRAYDALSVDALEVLAPDDFRALAVFDQARLEALARDDPAELVRLALRAYGPRLGMKDLKARLAPAVPADAWSKWWSAARAFVKRSPVIDVSEGPQPEFFLRHRAVAYEDTVRERYEAAAGLEEKLLVALGYLGEAGHNPQAEAAALGSFAADMAKWADASGGRSPAERLAAVVVLGEIRRHLGDQPCGTAGLPGRGDAASAVPTAGQAGRATSEPVSAASGAAAADDLLAAAPADLGPWAAAVRSDDLAGRVLAFIKERLPERWPGVFAAAMPAASMETCERIAGDLAAAGRLDLVAAAAAVCLRRPAPCLAALAWLWRNAAAEKFAPALGDLSRASMTVRLFQAINEVAMQDMPDRARKLELLGQARRTILHKEFAVLRDFL